VETYVEKAKTEEKEGEGKEEEKEEEKEEGAFCWLIIYIFVSD
jgi:hypothetical protein